MEGFETIKQQQQQQQQQQRWNTSQITPHATFASVTSLAFTPLSGFRVRNKNEFEFEIK